MRRIFNGNFKVTQKYHTGHIGMDIVGLSSKNIVSPVEGVVKTSTWVSKQADPLTWEWGNYVRVDDAKGNKHYFCHMASRAVSVGQRVQIGTKLGVMGNTGYSKGAHCHYQVRDRYNHNVMPHTVLGIPNEGMPNNHIFYLWKKASKGWTYGAFQNDWAFIDGCWYYFDGKYTASGPQRIDGKMYCFAPRGYRKIKEGQMLKTDEYGHLK